MNNTDLSNAKITLDISLLNEFTEFLNAKANGTWPAKEPECWSVMITTNDVIDDENAIITTNTNYFTSEISAREFAESALKEFNVWTVDLGKAHVCNNMLCPMERVVFWEKNGNGIKRY